MSALDTSVNIHGFHAGTPLGPAPGPLTATPENILECYQHGARVFEVRADHLISATAGRILIEQAGGSDFVFDLNVSADPIDLPEQHPFHCATVFCFHQGPADRIERAARLHMEKHGLPVSLKFSPIMLGDADINYLLHERLGLPHIDIAPTAWDKELHFDEAIALVNRLPGVAVKFSNVLEVIDRTTSQEMYLTGAPLHIIALRLAQKWRQNFGLSRPVGFSAGVTAENFVDCVVCGFAPITTCTDLLKPGGVSRFSQYVQNLESRMNEIGVKNLNEFILKTTGTIWSRALQDYRPRPLTKHQIGHHLWLSDWTDDLT